jgi:hypothetical protein
MRYLIICLALLFSNIAQSQNVKPFEGEILFKLEIKGGDEEMNMARQFMPTGFVYTIKGDNVLIKTLGTNSAIMTGNAVYNAKSNKAFLVQEASKTIYLIAPAREAEEVSEDASNVPLVVAGTETKTIAGYICKHFIIASNEEEGDKTEIWVTDAIQVNMPPALGDNMPNDQKIMSIVKGFPLAMQMEGPGGLKITMQAEKVEKKQISAGVFDMPKGFDVKPLDPNTARPGGEE